MFSPLRWLFPLLCCACLRGGELAAPTVARFIRVIVFSTGGGEVACSDKEVAGELSALFVPIAKASKVVWVGSDQEVAKLGKLGKLVICGRVDLLAAGGAVAIVAEGGRPTIYVNTKNLAGSGLTLSDSVLKTCKVVK